MNVIRLDTGARRGAAILAVAVVAMLAAGRVEAANPPNACSLLKPADVRAALGAPVVLRRGGSVAECVIRAGQHLPIIFLAKSSGVSGYKALLRAAGPPLKTLRGVGTQAVSYDHAFQDPQGVARGVIVRKGTLVLQLTTNDVGPDPPGLATVSQLLKLARATVQRV
jgi:siroheme synthase